MRDDDLEKLGALIDDQLPADDAEALKIRIEREPELLKAFSELLEATETVKGQAFVAANERPVPAAIRELLQDGDEDLGKTGSSSTPRGSAWRQRIVQISAVASLLVLGWLSLEITAIRSTLTVVQDSIRHSSGALRESAELSAAIARPPEEGATFLEAAPHQGGVDSLRLAHAAQNHHARRMAAEFTRDLPSSGAANGQMLEQDDLRDVMAKIWGRPVTLPQIGDNATFSHGRAVALSGTIMANLSYRVGNLVIEIWVAPLLDAGGLDGGYTIDGTNVVIKSDHEMTYAVVGSGAVDALASIMSAVVDAP